MKLLAHVMRNINEFNIPAVGSHGYEIMYFGVNLILMLDYRLSFDIDVKNSKNSEEIEVNNNSPDSDIKVFYNYVARKPAFFRSRMNGDII
jgi:hypothetical protein